VNPNDPIDRAAMAEVDALTPQVPALLPTADVVAAFKALEDKERRDEEVRAAYLQRVHVFLLRSLGDGYLRMRMEDVYVSHDGSKRVSGDEVRLLMYR
jgi:hypothetical protein